MLWNAADFQTLPLTASEWKPKDLPADVLSTPADELFPQARDAQAALAGVLLLYGHWERSHEIAQEMNTREGSYWHGIAHRIEPDSANAGYWLRRVGEHAIFPALYKDVEALLAASKTNWRLKDAWEPSLFIAWCDEARGLPGSEKHWIASQIQRVECERLFAWCAMKADDV
jgi:hypothetical protein